MLSLYVSKAHADVSKLSNASGFPSDEVQGGISIEGAIVFKLPLLKGFLDGLFERTLFFDGLADGIPDGL